MPCRVPGYGSDAGGLVKRCIEKGDRAGRHLTYESLDRGRRDHDKFRSLRWRIERRSDLSRLVFEVGKEPW